jgi:transglutaminase-like putative cysteine protease
MKSRTRRRLYLREAFVAFVLARLAVRLIAPARIFAWVNRPLRRTSRFSLDEVGWINWAVDTIAAKSAGHDRCLPHALAASAMLRRRGIASRLCLGVARENEELAGHAWVEVGDHTIIGDTGGDRFTRIAEFGAPRTV